jgi:hypothetical protein
MAIGRRGHEGEPVAKGAPAGGATGVLIREGGPVDGSVMQANAAPRRHQPWHGQLAGIVTLGRAPCLAHAVESDAILQLETAQDIGEKLGWQVRPRAALPRLPSPLSRPRPRPGVEERSDEHNGARKRLAFPIDLPVLLYWGMREKYLMLHVTPRCKSYTRTHAV